jgi:branched-chain amino acid transport system ATP-binding protein
VLKIKNLHVNYNGLSALSGVDLNVEHSQFISVVGPNGAGKTTLFKAISGTVEVAEGSIKFKGEDLIKVKPTDRPHLGIAHVPEGRQVFSDLTVRENLEMGAITKAGRMNWKENLLFINSIFPILEQRSKQLAGTLSGGQQQMLAISRAIASSPDLILFDEPSMGLAPSVADQIFEQIVSMHKMKRLTVLLVEQRAIEAFENCDAGYVLETGQVAMHGLRDELLANDRIRNAYFGF